VTFRSVAVPGGALSVEVLPGETEPALAIHGVSSNCRWAVPKQCALTGHDLRAMRPGCTLLPHNRPEGPLASRKRKLSMNTAPLECAAGP
jgi:hypothetical protein